MVEIEDNLVNQAPVSIDNPVAAIIGTRIEDNIFFVAVFLFDDRSNGSFQKLGLVI